MREDLEDRVEALIDTALGAPTASKRIAAARKALKLNPNAVEAYVILGLHMTTASERIALFREGARIGAGANGRRRSSSRQTVFSGWNTIPAPTCARSII